MDNLILFLNSFLSYLLVMAVIVVLGGVAIFIGIKLRKNKTNNWKVRMLPELAKCQLFFYRKATI